MRTRIWTQTHWTRLQHCCSYLVWAWLKTNIPFGTLFGIEANIRHSTNSNGTQ